MKLQVAIDRVDLETAKRLVQQLDGVVDIIELGTSLIKDYGFLQLKKAFAGTWHSELLYDGKTIDEGVYEFEKGFDAGADILTVMAASSVDTLTKVYDVTQQWNKQIFIDLMEVNEEKIQTIQHFEHAIYGLHHSKDSESTFDAADSVAHFQATFPTIKHISVAGGIDLTTAQKLADQGIVDSVIVGSKIVKDENPLQAAQKFMEVIR